MACQILVGNVDQIPKGEARIFKVDGQDIAIYHTHPGEVFATQPDCPHRGGPLADGLIGGTSVVCPLHDRSFDLRTGKNLSGDCIDIRTYSVTLKQDGGIECRLRWQDIAKGWGDDDLTGGLSFALHGKLGQGDAAATIFAPAQDEEPTRTANAGMATDLARLKRPAAVMLRRIRQPLGDVLEGVPYPWLVGWAS